MPGVRAGARWSTGEQHPLLTVIAEHSVALLTVVRAMVEDSDGRRRRSRRPATRTAADPDDDHRRRGPAGISTSRSPSRSDRLTSCGRTTRVGKVVAGHRPGALRMREGPCGIGFSSTSSWARCCLCSAGRKSKGWNMFQTPAPVILASNHLAVADSFYLPLVVQAPDHLPGQGRVLHRHRPQGLVPALVLHRGRAGADRPHRRRLRAGRADHRGAHPDRGQAARHVSRGHPLARRSAVQGQDRPGAGGAARPVCRSSRSR